MKHVILKIGYQYFDAHVAGQQMPNFKCYTWSDGECKSWKWEGFIIAPISKVSEKKECVRCYKRSKHRYLNCNQLQHEDKSRAKVLLHVNKISVMDLPLTS